MCYNRIRHCSIQHGYEFFFLIFSCMKYVYAKRMNKATRCLGHKPGPAMALIVSLMLPQLCLPSNILTGLSEGCRLLLAQRFGEAARAFHEARRQDSKCPEALAGEGVAYLYNGQFEAAQACWEQALALEETHSAAHTGLGTLFVLQGAFSAAIDHYQAALCETQAQQQAAIRAAGAYAACLAGLYEVAELEARRALQEQPGLELAIQTLAASLLARNRAQQALEVLQAPIAAALPQTLGFVATSPLFAPRAHFYVERRLEEFVRLTEGQQAVTSSAVAAPGAPAASTIFSRGTPDFRIEWPKPGSTVRGRIEVNVYVGPDVDVQYIAALIDEQFAGMSNVQPFRIYIDTALASDGLREIRIDAYGPGGTIVRTASVLVNVANGQRTLSEEEKRQRAFVNEFLQGLLTWRPHPLLRAQLVGYAWEMLGRLPEALEAYEYAFSYEPTLPCLHAQLLSCYQKIGLSTANAVREIHHLQQPQAVALTFDDGPHPILTPWILDLLDLYRAKATFFLVGKQVELYPELTREILKRGHEIGSHSYTHSNLRQLNVLGVERELVMSRQAIRRACGEYVTLFRPPGGNYDPQVRRAVELTGFTTVFWNENITSYPGVAAADILPKMTNNLQNGGIVLLHNGFDQTRELLPLLLPELAARGLKMDTISALTGHRPFRMEPVTEPLELRR